MSHAHNLKRKADWLKLNLIEDSIDRQKLRLRQGIGEREREGGGGRTKLLPTRRFVLPDVVGNFKTVDAVFRLLGIFHDVLYGVW